MMLRDGDIFGWYDYLGVEVKVYYRYYKEIRQGWMYLEQNGVVIDKVLRPSEEDKTRLMGKYFEITSNLPKPPNEEIGTEDKEDFYNFMS